MDVIKVIKINVAKQHKATFLIDRWK